jgi:hypothetical protein
MGRCCRKYISPIVKDMFRHSYNDQDYELTPFRNEIIDIPAKELSLSNQLFPKLLLAVQLLLPLILILFHKSKFIKNLFILLNYSKVFAWNNVSTKRLFSLRSFILVRGGKNFIPIFAISIIFTVLIKTRNYFTSLKYNGKSLIVGSCLNITL